MGLLCSGRHAAERVLEARGSVASSIIVIEPRQLSAERIGFRLLPGLVPTIARSSRWLPAAPGRTRLPCAFGFNNPLKLTTESADILIAFLPFRRK